ncbi:velvet factor-domain-containing protein [Mycena vulgaris]|nr:velvet factor-domain-containing protein [Mycena vulgaris]
MFIHPNLVEGGLASLRHELVVRQIPVEARARRVDRRILDPPPVVELCFYEPGTERRVPVPLYQLIGYTLQAVLVGADDAEVPDALSGPCSFFPFVARESDSGSPGAASLFFVFPGLSINLTGAFRLRFNLTSLQTNRQAPFHVVFSAPFRVVGSSQFRGLGDTTQLTRILAAHGASVRLRTERGTRTRSRATTDTDLDDFDPDVAFLGIGLDAYASELDEFLAEFLTSPLSSPASSSSSASSASSLFESFSDSESSESSSWSSA